MSTKEKAGIEEAAVLLISPAIREAANALRKRSVDGLPWDLRSALDTTLKRDVERVAVELLPRLAKVYKWQMIPTNDYAGVARLWVAGFLREAESTRSRLKTLANKHAKALVRECTEKHVQMRLVVPLQNFGAGRKFSLTGTIAGNRYNMRILPNAFPGDPAMHGFQVSPMSGPSLLYSLDPLRSFANWVVTIDVAYRKEEFNFALATGPHERQLQRMLLTALRLYKDGAVDGSACFFSKDSLRSLGGRSGSGSLERVALGAKYELPTEEIPSFRKLFHRLEGHLFRIMKLPVPIQISLEYFKSSYMRSRFSAFLDLHIALEALFDVQQEQRYRLALMTATFLESQQVALEATYELVGKLVKLRNKIAHGDRKLKERAFLKRVTEATPELRGLVRRLILKHIELFGQSTEAVYEKKVGEGFVQEFILQRLADR